MKKEEIKKIKIEKDIRSWVGNSTSRDKLRCLTTALNKLSDIEFNSSKFNSVEEICDYIYRLVVCLNLEKNNKQKEFICKEIVVNSGKDVKVMFWTTVALTILNSCFMFFALKILFF